MRRTVIAYAIALLALLPLAATAQIHFTASLDGAQETPPDTFKETGTYVASEIRGQLLYGGDVVASVAPVPAAAPLRCALDQNYPNPFNPSTRINFQVDWTSRVMLEMFNILGERMATLVDGVKAAGAYSVEFNASRIASGVYFYRLMSDGAALATCKICF